MPITNPQAVKFANENARTIADLIGKLDRTLDQFALNVVRDFETPTAGKAGIEPVEDGADKDGRSQVTAQNVAELKYVCEQLKACLDMDDRRAIVNRWTTNTQPLY